MIRPIFLIKNSHKEISVYRLGSICVFVQLCPGDISQWSLDLQWAMLGSLGTLCSGSACSHQSPGASFCQGPGHMPRNFYNWLNYYFSSLSKFLAKTAEVMFQKATWIVALLRAEEGMKPSVKHSSCPRPVIFTFSICSSESVTKDRHTKDQYSCLWKWILHLWLRS